MFTLVMLAFIFFLLALVARILTARFSPAELEEMGVDLDYSHA